MLHPIVAPPNPVTDDEKDHSKEATYKYPDFDKIFNPYWNAWNSESQQRLKEHDRLESYLTKIHKLDFKLRETWTSRDQPFITL